MDLFFQMLKVTMQVVGWYLIGVGCGLFFVLAVTLGLFGAICLFLVSLV